MKQIKPGYKIGFLGGGQLARMMSLKCFELGLQPYVMSTNSEDPAAQVTQNWVQGDLYNPSHLRKFLKLVDIATFESEFLDAKMLIEEQKKSNTKIFPSPKLMGQLQDRWTQKKLLEKFKLSTSPFKKIDNFSHAEKAFKEPFVLKQRHFGYDGYGTRIIKNKIELIKLKDFINQNEFGFIAEKFIPFKKELAILASRNRQGDIIFFPLVESHQKDSRCLWVKGPCEHKQLKSMKSKIKKMLHDVNYIGTIAFEFFDYKNSLIVNEIAPRVHNSGHYSMDALNIDQFEAHILALINYKLPTPQPLAKGFAMYNLLGQSNKSPKLVDNNNIHLHWYGKSQNRTGRKMGHINALDKNADLALVKLKKAVKDFQL